MKKITIAFMALVVSASAFAQTKTSFKDTITKSTTVTVDSTLHFEPNKAAQLFAVLNLSAEGIAHTTSKNITVEQATQALQIIADLQKSIKEWADRVTTVKNKSNPK